MHRGFVKLWRKTRESTIIDSMANSDAWLLFCNFLLIAAHEPREQSIGRDVVSLKKGQLIVGRQKLAKDFNCTENKIRSCLDLLEKMKMITRKATNKYSIISIVNWETYQSEKPTSHQQAANNLPTNHQQSTNKPPTNYQQSTTIEELEELEEEIHICAKVESEQEVSPPAVAENKPSSSANKKKSGASGFDRFWEAYPRKVGKKRANDAFLKARDKPPIDELLAIIERNKASIEWQKGEGQFIPHPTTWLSGARWLDEHGCMPKATTAANAPWPPVQEPIVTQHSEEERARVKALADKWRKEKGIDT